MIIQKMFNKCPIPFGSLKDSRLSLASGTNTQQGQCQYFKGKKASWLIKKMIEKNFYSMESSVVVWKYS